MRGWRVWEGEERECESESVRGWRVWEGEGRGREEK